MSRPEFMTGEELWDKFDALYAVHTNAARRQVLSEMPGVAQKVWHALAAELKIPRPKVPTLTEVYDEWVGDTVDADESSLEALRKCLNAAHEAKERKL